MGERRTENGEIFPFWRSIAREIFGLESFRVASRASRHIVGSLRRVAASCYCVGLRPDSRMHSANVYRLWLCGIVFSLPFHDSNTSTVCVVECVFLYHKCDVICLVSLQM